MNFDWIMQPFAQTIILGIGLAGSVSLWLWTKVEAHATGKAFEEFRTTTESRIRDLEARLPSSEENGPEILEVPAVSRPLTAQGLNLTTRTKALRMHRRGETISSIAATLQVQQEEVDLLVKLDRMLLDPAR